MKIEFEACLKSAPARALKIDDEGAAEITLVTDSTQIAEVLKLLTLAKTVFKITVEEVC